jgi:hypothetical protein
VGYTKWDHKRNDILDKLRIKPVIDCNKNYQRGTHEQNEYRNKPKTDFMISAKRTKVNKNWEENMRP